MALTTVLSNNYDFYSDGQRVDIAEPPLLDGSIGAEFTRLVATFEQSDVAGHGRVATVGTGQVDGLHYSPPLVQVARGMARVEFRVERLTSDAPLRIEGPPLLEVDVAATPESATYSGYGLIITTRYGDVPPDWSPDAPLPIELFFNHGGGAPAYDLPNSPSRAVRLDADPLPWLTAQIEWDGTDVMYRLLDSGGVELDSWSVVLGDGRGLPFQHLRSGGFHSADGSVSSYRVVTDNPYLAVDLGGPGHSAVTRLHPRDDGRGMSSAPRLYPPPKSRRVFGGYQ